MKAIIQKLLWPAIAALFCSLWLWAFTVELWMAPKAESSVYYTDLVELLDLPVVLFWRLFPAAGALDVWSGTLPGPDMNVFYQIFLATIANTVFFAAIGLAWKSAKRRGWLGAKAERIVRVGRLALAAATLTLAIWTIETFPRYDPLSLAAWHAAQWAELPVEAIRPLLPPELRGGPWRQPCITGVATEARLTYLRLPLHVLLGTLVYLSLYYLLRLAVAKAAEKGRSVGPVEPRTFNP